MLIPSIDLLGGQIVQLVQGEKLRLAFDDFEYWIEKFSRFPLVQLIDLDAAMRQGDNSALFAQIAKRLPVQAGGGIHTIERAQQVLDAGAKCVIIGSALFSAEGAVNIDFATSLAASVGAARLIRSMLYGTRPLDPAVFAAVAVALLLVAGLACMVPAWQASRLDPMRALRTE